MKSVERHFIADGSAMNIDLGFVPDYVYAVAKFEETNPVTYEWWKERANTANGNGQFGITRPANGGAVTKNASAAAGFAEYDTSANGVYMADPDPNANIGDLVVTTVVEYSAASTPTARASNVVGTVVRPSTRNGYVYECTTSSGAVGTEPTWPTTPGATVTDASSNVWACREEKTVNNGAKGVTIGASLSTDSDEWMLVGYLYDKVGSEIDSASQDPV